jgi:hypothetical protein
MAATTPLLPRTSPVTLPPGQRFGFGLKTV